MPCNLKIILIRPFEDFLSGLEQSLRHFSVINIALIILSFAFSWWIYVPIHELLHASGCIIGGGTVTELEISPLYGGALLERIIPFVSSGSEYAGQLTGFDTHGNDLIYLLTVFFPYLLTIFIGVPLLKSAANSTSVISSIKLGIALPMAFAPFISFSGDYFELGSIIVTRIASAIQPSSDFSRLISDDLFKLADDTFFSGASYSTGDIITVALSFILGIVLVYLTYVAGVLVSGVLYGGAKKTAT